MNFCIVRYNARFSTVKKIKKHKKTLITLFILITILTLIFLIFVPDKIDISGKETHRSSIKKDRDPNFSAKCYPILSDIPSSLLSVEVGFPPRRTIGLVILSLRPCYNGFKRWFDISTRGIRRRLLVSTGLFYRRFSVCVGEKHLPVKSPSSQLYKAECHFLED